MLNLDRSLDISQQRQFSILSSLKIVLNQKNSGPKKIYLKIIPKEGTSHLASYTFLQEMLINIKTRHFRSSINHQEHIFYRTRITSYFRPVNIAKFLRTAFLYNSRSSHLQMFFKIVILKSFANFTGKHLCWSLFFKNVQAQGLQLYLKRLQHRCFPVRFTKFLKTAFL